MPSSPVIVLSAEETRRAPYTHAFDDLVRGLRMSQLWGAMAWFDITQRYSRSVIGPFWSTLSLAILVLGLGVTYGALFRMPLSEMLPYLTIGMLVWTFISMLLTEGAGVFISSDVAIKQMPAPLSIHVYRLVWRAVLILGHNAAVALLVLMGKPWAVVTGIVPALAGLALIVLNGVAVCLAFGTLGARFRDLPPLMVNAVGLLFFVTPIMWRAEGLGERRWIADLNPIHHLVEIVRAPLLGEAFPLQAWLVSIPFTFVSLGVAFAIYARFRSRIPYWL